MHIGGQFVELIMEKCYNLAVDYGVVDNITVKINNQTAMMKLLLVADIIDSQSSSASKPPSL